VTIVTICLGALCRDKVDGDTVVLASDRMVTWAGLTEFEHQVPKIHQLSVSTWALIAGDALAGTRIARDVAQKLTSAGGTVEEIANLVAKRYAEVRMEAASAQILTARGLSLQQFYQMHQQLLPQIVGALDATLASFNLGVEMIIAGVDGTGAHLYTVSNPGGTAQCQDIIGAVAVGSGQLHAIQSMIGFRHGSMDPVSEVLFRVFSSKRRAELAPGVGHETDLAIVSPQGVRHLSTKTIDELERINTTVQSTYTSCLTEEVSKLTLEFADENADNEILDEPEAGASTP
jgi:20S proteasome alpha/beta subunit